MTLSALTTIDRARDSIELVESGLASAEQVLEGIEFVDAVGTLHRELKTRFDKAKMGWLTINGPIKSGSRRVFLAPDKEWKCLDQRATLEAILVKTGGDVDAVCDCLASGAFKQGATRKLLGEMADGLFEHVVTSKVKDEGGNEVVVERVQDVDLDKIEQFKR